MPMWAKRSIGLLLIWSVVGVVPSLARSHNGVPNILAGTANFGIKQLANGTLTLAASTPTPPRPYTSYTRYGLWDSAATSSDAPARGVKVDWKAMVPPNSELIVTVRGRMTNGHWSAWSNDVVAGVPVIFDTPMQVVQARVILLGSATAAPGDS